MNTMRYLYAIIGVTLLLLMNGCAMETVTPSGSAGSTDSSKPIVIGATLPLTGYLADTAQWCKYGYEAWQEDINSRGGLLGRRVELKIYDDEGKADKAAQLLEKLITVDKVDLILGTYGGPGNVAQAAVAEKYQYTYIGMGGHTPSFEQGYEFFFGGPPLLGAWWPRSFLEWLASLPDDQRPKTMGLINTNNVFGKDVQMAERQWAAQNPWIKIVMDELHDAPLPSAEALAAKVKQNGVEVLMIANSLRESALILKALKAQNYQPQLIWSGVGPDVPEWGEVLGELGEYVFSGTVAAPGIAVPGMNHFQELAEKKFKKAPNGYFMVFYNYGAVLEQAVKETNSLDNVKIRDWLKTHPVDTPLGTLRFNEKGLPEPMNYMTQVQNGRAELVFPRQPGLKEIVFPVPRWR